MDDADRLKQWMATMPRVLAHIVEEYVDYPNWMVNQFSPGDWDKLCPMLTFAYQRGVYGGDFIPVNVRAFLVQLQAKEMHMVSARAFAAHLGGTDNDHFWTMSVPCACGASQYLLDYVSCGGCWVERIGSLAFTLCEQGHLTFYHEDLSNDRKILLTSDQYVILREMEHRISILTKQQVTGLEPVRHVVVPIEKEAIALRNAWYPPAP